MNITEILPGIHYVGVNDRTTTRFEGLWSLPHGVSYNAYLVADEKVALIDTVEEAFGSRLFENIRETIGDRPIDYLVVNHMEPDHSSSIRALRLLYPDIRIVGNAKTLQMIQGFYGIDAGTLEVKEGDTISLGAKTLSFYMAPMVHWPETMVTWCAEAGTLFSGDAFGTFGAIDGGITDSQLDPSRYWDEMRRYYACIVGKYGGPVQKALAKVRGLNPTTICSTHGPVWQRQIPQVMNIYDRLSRYEGEPGVVLAYGSMYGNTEQMAERIARELASRGVGPIVIYNLSFADESVVLRDVFSGERPYIFVRHFYACASIIGALICALCWDRLGANAAMLFGAAAIVVLRLLAAYYHWSLPKSDYHDEPQTTTAAQTNQDSEIPQ